MAKNCLIYEALNDVKEMKVVEKNNGLMTLSGVFGVCGVRNNNQRVYEASNYSKMVQEMQERIKADGGIPGELEHPQMMNITLENISHKITDINIDENGVVTGTITLLNTPKGQIAQAIVEGGLPLHISSRATGAVDSKTGSVTLERIATYDLVGTPGFSQARLNLNENQIAESINESAIFYIAEKETEEETIENNTNTENMELNEIVEKLTALEAKVEELTNENEELRATISEMEIPESIDMKKLCDSIQTWVVEHYSPMVQKWVVEHYGETIRETIMEDTMDEVREHLAENFAPAVQTWVTEHYSPEVQKWAINEFAPGIQKWVVEEYASEVDRWMNESIMPKIEEKVGSMITESKKSNLTAIDETLKVLEGLEATKPTYSRKALITENADEPKFIQEMPAETRVKWDMASQEVKESIMRRAKLYNLVNEEAIDRFWESINFETVKPVKNIYEGLEAIVDERERDIRAKIRAARFRR